MNILGSGCALPEKKLSNFDLEMMLDTDNDWIVSRTGISERRILTDESMTDLCVRSSQLALKDAGTGADEIDLILCATLGGDFITPSVASLVQKAIGADCPAFDINAACTGFIYGLDVACSYLESGRAKKILLIAYDVLSKYVDWEDRSTAVLFGDGGGAVILEKSDLKTFVRLTSDGNSELLSIGASNTGPFIAEKTGRTYLNMNGREVFKFAVTKAVKELELVLEDAGMSKDDLDLVIMHQANIRIIDAVAQKLEIDKDKFPVNLDKFGNTSAGSIPLLLDQLNKEGKLKKGYRLGMLAFGAGLTTGACIISWNK